MLRATEIILNRKEILEQVTEEQIMAYYLGIIPSNELVTSPFRNDTRPGCSFWRHPFHNTLYFKDWALNKTWDFVGIVMERYNINYSRALTKISIDLPRIKANFTNSLHLEGREEKKIQVVVRDTWEEYENDYWIKRYGISKSLREKYQCKSVKSVYVNKLLTWRTTKANPIFCYYFPESDRVKVYRPFAKDKQYKWLSSCRKSDIIAYDLFIKGKPKHNVLFITSSGKDAMVLNSYGFPAIAPPSEGVLLEEETVNKIKKYYKYIFVFMDTDETGLRINHEYKSKFGLHSMHIPMHHNTKDVSDFRHMYGSKKTYSLIKKLIKECISPRTSSIPF